MVGTSFILIEIVEVDEAQGGFEMVHAKIFRPNPKPVTVVLGEVGLVITPLPETKVHNPVPTVGVLADNVPFGEETQSVCERPAFAMVGTSFTKIDIVAVELAQGKLEISHWKIFVPKPNQVIVVLGSVGLVIVPLHETNVHKPVPTVGVLSVIAVVGDEIQMV